MNKCILALVLALALTACGKSNDTPGQVVQQPQYYAPQQDAQVPQMQAPIQYAQPAQAPVQYAAPAAPVVVQQQPAQGGHDGTDMLMAAGMGYLAGHVLSGGGSGPSYGGGYYHPAPRTTVVNKTVIVNNHPAPAAPIAAPKPQPAPARTYTAPVTRSYSSVSTSSRKSYVSTPGRSFSSSRSSRR